MSLCEVHGEGKNGKICSFYITVKLAAVKYSRRLRLCGQCVDNMSTTFGDQWSDGFILVKTPASPTCVGCGTIAVADDLLHKLYATGYSRNDQRHDYSAWYCESCAKSVISQFRLEESRNGNG